MTKKEDIRTAVDDETRALVEAGHQAPKAKGASGDKLVKQLDRFASQSRKGNSGE
jgi:hypothetical protein